MDALQGLLRLFKRFVEPAVKLTQHALPRRFAFLDLVKIGFHVRREFHIHDVGEALLHQTVDGLAQRRGPEVFALLHDILTRRDGGDGGRVGGRAANALFLQRTDERGFGIARGGRGEVLLALEIAAGKTLPFLQRRQRLFAAGLLLILILLVHSGVAGEFDGRVRSAEGIALTRKRDGDVVINGVRHLAGREASPDQPVQAVLLARETFAHAIGRKAGDTGANGFVRILRVGAGFEAAGLTVIKLLAVMLLDERPGRRQRILRQTQRVGTHIGDKAHGALTLDVHAFIQLLGDGHGAPRRHTKAARSLLLKRGGDERRRRAALLGPVLDGLHLEGLALDGLDDRFDLLLVFQFLFLLALAMELRREARAVLLFKLGVKIPVFLGREVADLLFAVDDHARGHGLHTAGGKPLAHLAPQKRRELIAHDAVKDAARLLRVHQILIDVARMGQALAHNVFRDLVEGDAPGFFVRQLQKLLQMPADGLALAVRVGCEIDGTGALGRLFQLRYDRLAPLDGLIMRLKIVFQIHAHGIFRQITQMSHRGDHLIVAAKVFLDRPGLGRGLHDHQILFRHAELSFLTGQAVAPVLLPHDARDLKHRERRHNARRRQPGFGRDIIRKHIRLCERKRYGALRLRKRLDFFH